MKTRKQILALVMSAVMLLSAGITAQAVYTPQYAAEAEELYELGLFAGAGTNPDGSPDFALGRQATRIEGLVMLIRLLGEEDEAKAFAGSCPFTDVPNWAKNYAGYAYAKGYTKGTSATTFSDGPLYSNAFLTFTLRALGYDDAVGDFSYNTACQMAAEVGIIDADEYADQKTAIYRDDCAKIAYDVLNVNLKGSKQTLKEKLVSDGAISDTDDTAKTEPKCIPIPLDVKNSKIYTEDICKVIPETAYFETYGEGGYSLDHVSWNSPKNLSNLLMSTRVACDYITGKSDELAQLELWDSGYIHLGSPHTNTFCVVLNADYQLIAYCIIPPDYSQKTVYFSTCEYGGKTEIEQMRNYIQNVPKFDKSAVSSEKISVNGETETRVCIDKTKLPANAQDFQYYSYWSTNLSEIVLLLHEHTTFRSLNDRFYEYGVDAMNKEFPLRSGMYLFLFDDTLNVVAYTQM